jgi:hypothetical protein
MLPTLPYSAIGPRPATGCWIDELTRCSVRVIDGGAAKCPLLEELALSRFQRKYGRRGMHDANRHYGLTFLEADWAATDWGLFYITPAAGFVWMRRWQDVTLSVDRRRRKSTKVRIVDGAGGHWVWVLEPAAAANLITIARHYLAA